jgi:CheY-like chemotaxis protein
MVQGLAAQSNGRLVLKSRLGEGTTAEIWLPAAEIAAHEKKTADIVTLPRGTARSLTVLVVDDDPLVLENVAARLEDLGHRVIEARSGPEALNLLVQVRTLDLVITDYAMPIMTGAQLLERISWLRPDIPAILATGYAELSSGQTVHAIRLMKPFDQNALAQVIHAATTAGDSIVHLRPKQPLS